MMNGIKYIIFTTYSRKIRYEILDNDVINDDEWYGMADHRFIRNIILKTLYYVWINLKKLNNR